MHRSIKDVWSNLSTGRFSMIGIRVRPSMFTVHPGRGTFLLTLLTSRSAVTGCGNLFGLKESFQLQRRNSLFSKLGLTSVSIKLTMVSLALNVGNAEMRSDMSACKITTVCHADFCCTMQQSIGVHSEALFDSVMS